MLVLSRRDGQGVTIEGAGLKVHIVTKFDGHGKVKLCFQAPKEIRIDRDEIVERRKHEDHGLSGA